MADGTRAEELVQTMEREPAFQQEVETASTLTDKRQILDAHGFQDVSLEDMKAYVEGQGGTLVLPPNIRDLSDEELEAVVGGLTSQEETTLGFAVGGAVGVAVIAASAAAA